MDLNDNADSSTKLEGKKLKDRGVETEGTIHGGEQLEIDHDAPAVGDEVGTEVGQEYFIEREFGEENEKEREERLKREMEAARREQLEMQKQRQQEVDLKRGPNGQYNEIERGLKQTQNRGRPTVETEFKKEVAEGRRPEQEETKSTGLLGKAGDAIAAVATLGASEDMKITEKDNAPKNSIPATRVPDQRGGKGSELGF